jgi:DNA-directed RNA polymerase specialized sigma24 family protein
MAKFYDNDDFLLQRLKSDDEKALEFLFRQYYADLLRVSFRIVGNSEQARDIIQEVFARLYMNLHGNEGLMVPKVKRISFLKFSV